MGRVFGDEHGVVTALYRRALSVADSSPYEGFEAMSAGTLGVPSSGGATGEAAGGATVPIETRITESITPGIMEAIGRADGFVAGGRQHGPSFGWRATAEAVADDYRELA